MYVCVEISRPKSNLQPRLRPSPTLSPTKSKTGLRPSPTKGSPVGIRSISSTAAWSTGINCGPWGRLAPPKNSPKKHAALLKKTVRRSKKYHAHDEANAYRAGDNARIIECAPKSKTKTWEVLPKGGADQAA